MILGAEPLGEVVIGSTETSSTITTINKSFIIKWNIYNSLYKNIRFNWDIQNGLARNFNINWNILNQVNNDLIINWDIPITISITASSYYTLPRTNRTYKYTG